MGHEEANNNGMPEDENSENESRRRFLKGGAVAAASALASQSVAAGTELCGEFPFGGVILGPDGKPQPCHKPDDSEAQGFAKVMSAAWKDKAYREDLLTFDEGRATDWFWYSKDERKAMLKKTRMALEKYISVGSELPVVLSNMQFERGVFRMMDPKERILRLPDRPKSLDRALENDAFYAFVVKNHICGM